VNQQSSRRWLIVALIVFLALIVAVVVPLAIGVRHGNTVKLPPEPTPRTTSSSEEPQ